MCDGPLYCGDDGDVLSCRRRRHACVSVSTNVRVECGGSLIVLSSGLYAIRCMLRGAIELHIFRSDTNRQWWTCDYWPL